MAIETIRTEAEIAEAGGDELATLRSIEQRVLWLSTAMIHHANTVRPNPDKTKVGGHQASSASAVTVLTALYLKYLRAGDRIAVKPHAAPAFHALQYLLGNLDRRYLTELRSFHGLQPYPSRTKDPDNVDFSTGSMGLGVVAPLFAALADRYICEHFGTRTQRRFVSLSGDAELDEGSVWEAAADEAVRGVGNVLFIIDLNRQSLDRVVPGVRAAGLEAMFRGCGWHVLEAKYGRRLQAAFARPGGEALRRRIDDMDNQEYQVLIRRPGEVVRERLVAGAGPDADEVRRAIADTADDDLPGLLADLGGHDLAELLDKFEQADAVSDRPTVLFAYTIKGWSLPIAADPLNHSALLTDQQYEAYRDRMGLAAGEEWDAFPADSPEARLLRDAAERLREDRGPGPTALAPADVPAALDVSVPAITSTQEAFGNLMAQLARVPRLGERIVTSSPDVTVSTNLGAWVNRTGVFALEQAPNFDDAPRLLRWEPGPKGQHIELGISEINLFLLLGQFGLTQELFGELLIPVGTLYDPFVCRGLDPLFYSVYAGSKFVFAATPSGVTLSPEGGAHQSVFTPSIGLELPRLVLCEPAFARELEWLLLDAIRACCDREQGHSSYLRLVTRPVDQSLLQPALARIGEAELRRQVLAGGYRLLDAAADGGPQDGPAVQIMVSGAMVPEALDAARQLWDEGVAANVINLTSADRVYTGLKAARFGGVRGAERSVGAGYLDELIPAHERRAPIVSVLDGASHTYSFLGTAYGVPQVPLGVDDFGQAGRRADLYGEYGIDAEHIVNAALVALELAAQR